MLVKARKEMPSQCSAFRHNVAAKMDGYNERMARKIREEASRHGETSVDLAAATGVHPSTTDRWFKGLRAPQPRHRKVLIGHWKLDPDFFAEDIEAEEEELRLQISRLERKVDRLLAHAEKKTIEQIEAEFAQGADQGRRTRD